METTMKTMKYTGTLNWYRWLEETIDGRTADEQVEHFVSTVGTTQPPPEYM